MTMKAKTKNKSNSIHLPGKKTILPLGIFFMGIASGLAIKENPKAEAYSEFSISKEE
jgi:hypothetical protein